MQDENNNQPVILNLNPVNDSISQFIQIQSGILSEEEIFIPSDSILPIGTRVKIEYRLKSFGQKENVKIIDAIGEVIGPEVDSEKGRRGVRVKFIKMSPTSQMLIQKLLEKMKVPKPPSGEKRIETSKTSKPEAQKTESAEATIKTKSEQEPSVKINEPKVTISEPKVQINEPTPPPQPTPSISDIMANLDTTTKKEEIQPASEQGQTTLADIMSREIEKPKSSEIKVGDDKPAEFIFEYLPPGQPIEENTGIVKIREIVRSTDISKIKKTPKILFTLLLIVIIIGGVFGFFFFFPQYAPKIFVKSQEVSSIITKRDLTPEIQPTSSPTPTQISQSPSPTPTQVNQEETVKKEEKVEEKKIDKKEEEKKEEKAAEPEIQPLTSTEEKGKKKEEGVKIISSTKIKKEREKEKRESEEKDKRISEEKAIAKAEDNKAKTNKETKQTAEPAKLIIQVTPTDADLTVFIDGNQIGTMPTLTKQLPAGSHTIKVVADGYNDEVRKIDLSEGETKTIKVNLKEK